MFSFFLEGEGSETEVIVQFHSHHAERKWFTSKWRSETGFHMLIIAKKQFWPIWIKIIIVSLYSKLKTYEVHFFSNGRSGL